MIELQFEIGHFEHDSSAVEQMIQQTKVGQSDRSQQDTLVVSVEVGQTFQRETDKLIAMGYLER